MTSPIKKYGIERGQRKRLHALSSAEILSDYLVISQRFVRQEIDDATRKINPHKRGFEDKEKSIDVTAFGSFVQHHSVREISLNIDKRNNSLSL